jgi:hypothetical protein
MATRSTISLVHKNGSVSSIYCHFDGYVENGVGQTLFEHYNDYEKIVQLMELGSLSYLDGEIGVQQDFNNPQPGMCLAYHRDRGDIMRNETYLDISVWLKNHYAEEYNYIWIEGEWFCLTKENFAKMD